MEWKRTRPFRSSIGWRTPEQVSYTFPCSERLLRHGTPQTGHHLQGAPGWARRRRIQSTTTPAEPYPEFTTKGTSTPPSATSTRSPTSPAPAPTSPAPSTPTPPPARSTTKAKPPTKPTGTSSAPPNARPHRRALRHRHRRRRQPGDLRRRHPPRTPNTYYEVKLIAHNAVETVETPVQTFDTPLVKPSVEPAPGGSDGEGGYILEGVVNSNNSKITDCQFEYGTTGTYPNTYNAPCLPSPSGPDEVQQVNVDAGEGQFKLSFRGQTTADIAYNATRRGSAGRPQGAVEDRAVRGQRDRHAPGLRRHLRRRPRRHQRRAAQVLQRHHALGGGGGGGVSVSTTTEGGIDHPVSVEAHLEDLTLGSTYHFRIFATNAAGTESSADRTFIPTLAAKGPRLPQRTAAQRKQLRSACPNAAPTRWSPIPTRKATARASVTSTAATRLHIRHTRQTSPIQVRAAFDATPTSPPEPPPAGKPSPISTGPPDRCMAAPEYAKLPASARRPWSTRRISSPRSGHCIKEGSPVESRISVDPTAGSNWSASGTLRDFGSRCLEVFVGASDDLSHLVFPSASVISQPVLGPGRL